MNFCSSFSISDFSPYDIKLLQKNRKEKESNSKRKVHVFFFALGSELIPMTDTIHRQDKDGGWYCSVCLLSGSIVTGTCLSSLVKTRLVKLSSFDQSRTNDQNGLDEPMSSHPFVSELSRDQKNLPSPTNHRCQESPSEQMLRPVSSEL